MREGMRPTGGGLALLWLALALSLAAAPVAAADDPYDQVSLALGQGLVTSFPAAEGLVVSASGEEVFIDLAERDLMRPGLELQVYRPGEPIVHPVTGKVLGNYEETLGYLSLAEVREKYSRGRLAPGASPVEPGDKVRVTARRLRGLLRFTGSIPGVEVSRLALSLVGRGEQSGRFTLLDEPQWHPSLAAIGVPPDTLESDPEAMKRLGEAVPADLLLLVTLRRGSGGGEVALDIRSLHTGAPLGVLSAQWTLPPAAGEPAPAPAATAESPAAGAPAPAPTREAQDDGLYVSRDLTFAPDLLATGNLTGEGALEVLFAEGKRLALYRWGKDALEWVWEEKDAGGKVLDLQAGDLDGDGRAEAVVTTLSAGRVRTVVRSWRGKAFEPISEHGGLYLRLVAGAEGRAAVLGQRTGVDAVLSGRVERYRWRDGGLETSGGDPLPAAAGIFGLALAGAPGAEHVFALDGEGYLTAYSAEGNALWRSPERLGGLPSPVSAAELFGLFPSDEVERESRLHAFRARVLAGGAAGDVRVYVLRNFTSTGLVLARHRWLGQGEAIVYGGSPEDLRLLRRSRGFDGYVADLAVADADRDGKKDLLILVRRRSGTLLGERATMVLWGGAGV